MKLAGQLFATRLHVNDMVSSEGYRKITLKVGLVAVETIVYVSSKLY